MSVVQMSLNSIVQQFICTFSSLQIFSKVRVISDETVLLRAITHHGCWDEVLSLFRYYDPHSSIYYHSFIIILEGNETNKNIIIWFWGTGPNRSF